MESLYAFAGMTVLFYTIPEMVGNNAEGYGDIQGIFDPSHFDLDRRIAIR